LRSHVSNEAIEGLSYSLLVHQQVNKEWVSEQLSEYLMEQRIQ